MKFDYQEDITLRKNIAYELDKLKYDEKVNREIKQFLKFLHKASISKRQVKLASMVHLKPLTDKALAELYWNISDALTRQYRQESHPTIYEGFFLKHSKLITKSKIYGSFWIKNFCVDFFMPSMLLVIEIDGGIHYQESKCKKDNYKEEFLKNNYGISVARCENREIPYFLAKILPHLKGFQINTKLRKKIMVEIYLETISHHSGLKTLSSFLGGELFKVYAEYKCSLERKGLKKQSRLGYNHRHSSLSIEYSGSNKPVVSQTGELWK